MAEGAQLSIDVIAETDSAESKIVGFSAETSKALKAAAEALLASSDKMNAAFTRISTSAAKSGDTAAKAVSKFQQGVKIDTTSATQSLTDLGRVAQDLPFGFVAIVNNLNPLQESFSRASAAAKEAGVSISKYFLSALSGPAGIGIALSLVSSALTFASVGLSAWTRGFSASKKEIKDAADEAEKFIKNIKGIDEITKLAASSVDAQVRQVNALSSVLSNVNEPLERRKNALRELQNINKSYFGQLTIEKSSYQDIANAVSGYTEAIIKNATVKGLSDELGKVSSEIVKQKRALNDLYKAYNIQKEAITTIDEATEGGARSQKDLLDALKPQRDAILKQQGVIKQLETSYNDLGKEIEDQVKTSLSLKPLTSFGDKTLKEAEARAKRISEIISDLSAKQKNIADNPKLRGADRIKEQFDAVQNAVEDLRKLKVPDSDTLLSKLIGERNQLNNQLIKDQVQEAIDNISTFKRLDKIPVYVEVKPAVEKDAERHVSDLLKKSDLLGLYDNIGMKVPGGAEASLSTLMGMYDEYRKKIDSVKNAVNEMKSAFDSAFERILKGDNIFKTLLSTIGQLLARLASVAATSSILALLLQGTKAGSAINDNKGNTFKDLFGLFSGGLFGGLGKLFGFADGGIVSGPTRALVGEYPGASSNPEVIAPLDKLKSLIGGAAGGASVVIPDLRFDGRDFIIAFQQAQKSYNR